MEDAGIKYFNNLIKKSLFQNIAFYDMIAKGVVFDKKPQIPKNLVGGKQYGNDNDTENSGCGCRS